MKNKNFPLAISTWDNKEISAIKKILSSGSLTMGSYVRKYENMFAKLNGNKFAIMTNSGSSANLLMFSALFYTKQKNLKLKKGDEIIVPAVSWSTSYAPLYQLNLKMKFVDIDIETLNYNLKNLERSISNKTRAIFCINVLGNSNNFLKIKNIIKNKKIYLVEDNCESLGAEYNKKKVGNYGIMSSFSSYFSHHISTIEGGMITTNDKELYHLLLSLRAHGWTRDLPKKNMIVKKNNEHFKEFFNFILPGYNLRPTEIGGVAGIEQLKKFANFLKIRKENALQFQKLFSNNKDYIIQKEIGKSSWFAFSFITKNSSISNFRKLIKILEKLRIDYRPIISGNFAKKIVAKKFFKIKTKSLKNANYIDKYGLMIGNNPIKMKSILTKLSKLL